MGHPTPGLRNTDGGVNTCRVKGGEVSHWTILNQQQRSRYENKLEESEMARQNLQKKMSGSDARAGGAKNMGGKAEGNVGKEGD